jgi:hypothetical protein
MTDCSDTPARSPEAVRVARYYARKKAGLACFTFVDDEIEIKAMLEDASLLAPHQWDNPAAVAIALTEFMRVARKERFEK